MALDITSYAMGKKAGGSPAPTPTYEDKQVSITTNGTQTITADEGYDALSSVEIATNVQPDLESKSITITTNTTTTVNPTSGKDGLSSVEITTNIPQPSGKITITENGTNIDISSYATADVSVGGSAPTTLAEFSQQVTNMTNSFLNYLDTTYIQNRTAYTNQSVNLYTPDIDCKFYVIRKRNDVYSVIWNNSVAMYRDYSNFMTSTPILYSTQSGAVQSQLALGSNPRLQFRQASANQKGYYSNETFSTADEAVSAMLNNQITYTQNSGNNYYIQADTPYMCPYSNMVLVDTSTGENILKDTMVISHNETIVAMS